MTRVVGPVSPELSRLRAHVGRHLSRASASRTCGTPRTNTLASPKPGVQPGADTVAGHVLDAELQVVSCLEPGG